MFQTFISEQQAYTLVYQDAKSKINGGWADAVQEQY